MEKVWSHDHDDFPGRKAVVEENPGAMESWRRFRTTVWENEAVVGQSLHASFWMAKLTALELFYGSLDKAKELGAM